MKLLRSLTVCLVFSTVVFVDVCFAEKNKTIQQLEEQLLTNKEDPLTLYKLASAYHQQHTTSKKLEDIDKAINHYKHFLKLSPQNQRALFNYYQTQIAKFVLTKKEEDFKKFESFYQSASLLQESSNIHPPIMIRSTIEANKKTPDAKKLIQYLKSAIKEKPKYTNAYILLAETYKEEKHYELSIETLKKLSKLLPNVSEIFRLQGEVFTKQMYATDCLATYPEHMSNAIKAYRKASTLNPKEPYLHSRLMRLYQQKGLFELALHEVKRTADLYKKLPLGKKEMATELALVDIDLAELKIGLGEDPEPFIKKIVNYYKTEEDKEFFGKVLYDTYINTWKWQKSLDLAKELGTFDKPEKFFSGLRIALAIQKTENKKVAQKYLKKVSKDFTLTPWEEKIYQHFLGKLANSAFLVSAKDICQKTEAYYYTGIQEWEEGDTRSAKQHFKDVQSFNLPSYTEYQGASQALISLAKEKP